MENPKASEAEIVMEAILTRRSVREFTGSPIQPEVRRALLEAANAAPSAHGRRPWRFAAIDSPELKAALVEAFPWFSPASSAGFLVLVLGKPDCCMQEEYWTVDCAAATENLLIAARALGLGSVWMGISPVKANVAKFLDLVQVPPGLVPFSLVAVGKPESGVVWKRREPVFEEGLIVEVAPRR
jgi:nitroreductase